MTAPASKGEQTRQRILDCGRRLVLAGGFVGVGLKQILDESRVPKGSFYHYFESKEAFGCALLQDYVDHYLSMLDQLISQPQSAAERLMAYLSPAVTTAGAADRCLIVKLAAEIADLSEHMRAILSAGVEDIIARLTRLFEQGSQDGTLRVLTSPRSDAQALYNQWLGAMILSKLTRDNGPLQATLADSQARYMI